MKKINVRIISATNRNLEEMVNLGLFREDLFYRLKVVEIKIPSLKERKEDIPLLCEHFINKFGKEQNKKMMGLTEGAKQLLLSHNYKGNVREVSNILEYAVIMSNDNIIKASDLPIEKGIISNRGKAGGLDSIKDYLANLSLQEVEKLTIEAHIQNHGDMKKDIALKLGISERGLRNKLKEYNIE